MTRRPASAQARVLPVPVAHSARGSPARSVVALQVGECQQTPVRPGAASFKIVTKSLRVPCQWRVRGREGGEGGVVAESRREAGRLGAGPTEATSALTGKPGRGPAGQRTRPRSAPARPASHAQHPVAQAARPGRLAPAGTVLLRPRGEARPRIRASDSSLGDSGAGPGPGNGPDSESDKQGRRRPLRLSASVSAGERARAS